MNDPDLDAEFARIIAGWDSEAPDPSPATAGGEPPSSPGAAGEPPSSPDPADDTAANAPAEPSSADAPAAPADLQPNQPTAPNEPTEPGSDRHGLEHPESGTSERGAGPGSGAVDRGVLGLPIAPTTAHVWRGAEPPREDVDDLLESVDPTEEHFVPPTDPDLPTAEDDPMFWAIVVGLAGGPLLLLYLLLFDRDGSSWWIVTALTMIVVGFVLLVLRGGTERDPSDDGTRV